MQLSESGFIRGDYIRSTFWFVGCSMAEQGRLAGGCGNNRGTYKHTATRSVHEVKIIVASSLSFE